jgi:hypothetical protein
MRNSLHNLLLPINQLPPETLALIATHLAKERELINATAVCQYWRMALLSFPRLWCNVGGSPAEIEAYLERSKSVPIDAHLYFPERDTKLIVPHTHRLAALTIRVRNPPHFSKCVESLRCPIPTLRSFRIDAEYGLHIRDLKLPSSILNGSFSHLKKLEIGVVSSFRGSPEAFPCVTELTLHTNAAQGALLDTFEQLPSLEKVHITFRPRIDFEPDLDSVLRVVTLPHVKEMSLSTFKWHGLNPREIPWRIIGFFDLPNLTSLRVQSADSVFPYPILPGPITPFGEKFPNLAELPELRVDLGLTSSEISFKGPSQAVFSWIMPGRPQQTPFLDHAHTLQTILLRSVRRLTVYVRGAEERDGDGWLVDFLRDLTSLERLEVGGECGGVLKRLYSDIVKGKFRLHIKNLIVRGGED